jgi:hypothetical protein
MNQNPVQQCRIPLDYDPKHGRVGQKSITFVNDKLHNLILQTKNIFLIINQL